MKSIAEIFRSYGILDENGRHINGTDKETNHRYGDAYERIINSVFNNVFDDHDRRIEPRDTVKLMMEVGVADGSCLLAWREIFLNATIVGADIHHSDKAHGERIEFHIGNQYWKEDCDRVAGGRQFDMIVEDATHRLEYSLLTLLYLWPFVKPGGIYVIEEFEHIGGLQRNVRALWPNVTIIDVVSPFGGTESLVVFRKRYD